MNNINAINQLRQLHHPLTYLLFLFLLSLSPVSCAQHFTNEYNNSNNRSLSMSNEPQPNRQIQTPRQGLCEQNNHQKFNNMSSQDYRNLQNSSRLQSNNNGPRYIPAKKSNQQSTHQKFNNMPPQNSSRVQRNNTGPSYVPAQITTQQNSHQMINNMSPTLPVISLNREQVKMLQNHNQFQPVYQTVYKQPYQFYNIQALHTAGNNNVNNREIIGLNQKKKEKKKNKKKGIEYLKQNLLNIENQVNNNQELILQLKEQQNKYYNDNENMSNTVVLLKEETDNYIKKNEDYIQEKRKQDEKRDTEFTKLLRINEEYEKKIKNIQNELSNLTNKRSSDNEQLTAKEVDKKINNAVNKMKNFVNNKFVPKNHFNQKAKSWEDNFNLLKNKIASLANNIQLNNNRINKIQKNGLPANNNTSNKQSKEHAKRLDKLSNRMKKMEDSNLNMENLQNKSKENYVLLNQEIQQINKRLSNLDPTKQLNKQSNKLNNLSNEVKNLKKFFELKMENFQNKLNEYDGLTKRIAKNENDIKVIKKEAKINSEFVSNAVCRNIDENKLDCQNKINNMKDELNAVKDNIALLGKKYEELSTVFSSLGSDITSTLTNLRKQENPFIGLRNASLNNNANNNNNNNNNVSIAYEEFKKKLPQYKDEIIKECKASIAIQMTGFSSTFFSMLNTLGEQINQVKSQVNKIEQKMNNNDKKNKKPKSNRKNKK